MLDNIVVKLLNLLKVLVGNFILGLALKEHALKVLIAEIKLLCVRSLKELTLTVKVDWNSTVVNLIGNSKCRVIVIDCTDIPHVLGELELTVDNMLRIGRPYARNKGNNPLIS